MIEKAAKLEEDLPKAKIEEEKTDPKASKSVKLSESGKDDRSEVKSQDGNESKDDQSRSKS